MKGNLTSEKYAATSQHKSNLRNIRGTFATEGMAISKLTELRAKYEKRF